MAEEKAINKCKICGKEYFNRGLGCSKDFTCEDIKLLYNDGKSSNYIIINNTIKNGRKNIK